MISDDGWYTLWHMRTTRRAIRKLARLHDIFSCTKGDCDRSFDYTYYRDGKLLREYVVHSPEFSDRKVSVDRGPMLLGEKDILDKDGSNIGIDVAASLGIRTTFEADDLRIFVPACDS